MICSQINIKYYDDFELTNFNTLRIKALAKRFYVPDNYGEMISLYKKYKKDTPILLGNGSNILLSSIKIEKPMITPKSINSVFFFGQFLEVEMGAKVQKLSTLAQQKGLSGFEFLVGIPASLGGAIYQNAGAHGQTISDHIIRCKVYDYVQNKTLILSKEEMKFSYRSSILKEKPYILLSAKFKLPRANKEVIKARMDENLAFRKNRQPNLSMPNAGSVFKNPENSEFSAGALIDKCGLKGYQTTNCKIYENHCNFIINKGNANSIDYTNIMFEIYSRVKEKFNIELEPEIIYIGKMTEEEENKWKIMLKK